MGQKVEAMEPTVFLVACDTTYAAMSMQRGLAAINPTVIPTPREISEACGMALRFNARSGIEAREIVEAILQARGFCALYAETDSPQRYTLVCRL
jgi:hypothetical protein